MDFSIHPNQRLLSADPVLDTEQEKVIKTYCRDFPGDPVVKTSLSNAGSVGLIPGPGAKTPHAAGHWEHVLVKQQKLCARARQRKHRRKLSYTSTQRGINHEHYPSQ